MSREPQKQATLGSQKWLQVLINDRADLINRALAPALKLQSPGVLHWRSPLRSDDYAEYRDECALELLGIDLQQRALEHFWPAKGPRWDALAVAGESPPKPILVEAKSHICELCSTACGAKGQSLRTIEASLAATRTFLGSTTRINWSKSYYQYANRLAHLYLLRELNGLDAYLVFVYFLNDEEMGGPRTVEEWKTVIELAERSLGVCGHRLSQFAPKVFIDVNELRAI
jgi:hypothetical protein